MYFTLLVLANFLFTHHSWYDLRDIPCEVAYEREILNTKSKRVDMAPQYFFSFSHREIKSFYKEKNFIETYCQISKNNGMLHLNLNLKLASSAAKKEYGVISKESNLIIHFIKGGQVDLPCVNGSLGISNDDTNQTVYALTYQIDKSQTRKLKKQDVDKVSIEWSSGYEDYEVYEVDAILNQLICLEKMGVL